MMRLITPRNTWLTTATALFLAVSPADLRAEVKLADIFSNGMVLQQQMPVTVWGEAAPGEAVSVELAGSKANTKADAEGQWRVKLPALKAGGPHTMNVTGQNQLSVTDVLVGEVWLCSGQSNMEWTIKGTLLPEVSAKVIAEADYPQIRVLTVPRRPSLTPEKSLGGTWQVCNPQNAPGFSATGYFFGREIHKKLNVPVGLIVSAVGGTPSESWTPLVALEKDPAYPAIAALWEKRLADYPAAKKRYDEEIIPKWQAAVEKAKAEGKPLPRKPSPPYGPEHNHRPSVLFNAMIAPMIPYTLRGVTWYQGESNADTVERAMQYYSLFPTMIRDWRARWGQGELPFLFVQLANFKDVQTQPVEPTAWPFLREAQTKTLALPNTGMALAIDINDEPANIHPRNKEEVGRRLALAALAQVYGQKIAYSGPMYAGMAAEGGKIRLRFNHAEGLTARSAESKLTGFAIAGADGKFVWADAVVDGQTVVVSSPEVSTPTAVRYGWAMSPIGNLYNGAGLPASPFRTDESAK